LEVLDFTPIYVYILFLSKTSECETVQENVKVFADFHKSSSLAHRVFAALLRLRCPLGQVLSGHPYEILPPIALRMNVGFAFRSECSPRALGRLSANF